MFIRSTCVKRPFLSGSCLQSQRSGTPIESMIQSVRSYDTNICRGQKVTANPSFCGATKEIHF